MDLKWILVGRIALVALTCLLAYSALALYQTASQARQRNVGLADAVARQLELQLWRIGTSLDIPRRFPDWDLVTSYSLQPGQCVQFMGVDPARRRSSCSGIDTLSPRCRSGSSVFISISVPGRSVCVEAGFAPRRIAGKRCRRNRSSRNSHASVGHHRATLQFMRGPRDLSLLRHLRRDRSRAPADEGNFIRLEPPGTRRPYASLAGFPPGRAQSHQRGFQLALEDLSIATSERTDLRAASSIRRNRSGAISPASCTMRLPRSSPRSTRMQRASETARSAMRRGSSTRPGSWRRWLPG